MRHFCQVVVPIAAKHLVTKRGLSGSLRVLDPEEVDDHARRRRHALRHVSR